MLEIRVNANPAPILIRRRASLATPAGLLITALLGTTLILNHSEGSYLSASFLFLLNLFLGPLLISRLAVRLGDSNIERLKSLYLGKLLLVTFFSLVVWSPGLESTSEIDGFDPLRYYYIASILAEQSLNLDVLENLSVNFNGIILYYAIWFYIFGTNTAIAALGNIFLTLLATLVLIESGYRLVGSVHKKSWLLGLSMFVPELIWYDSLSSRETFCMALFTLVILMIGKVMIKGVVTSKTLPELLLASFLILPMGLVRISLVLPVIISLFLMFIFVRTTSSKRLLGIGAIGLLCLIATLVPQLSSQIGSVASNLIQDMSVDQFTKDGFNLDSASINWAERSLGQAFMAESPYQIVLYAPIKMLFYLVAPLPNFPTNLSLLVALEWSNWMWLLVALSAIIYVITAPLMVAGVINTFFFERRTSWALFVVPFLTLLGSIAVGNQIIHERYRVMTILLLWGCIWLGNFAPWHVKKFSSFVCGVAFIVASGFYLVFKYF